MKVHWTHTAEEQLDSIYSFREIIEPPYRIIYLIKSDRIDIIAVLHASMDPFSKGNEVE